MLLSFLMNAIGLKKIALFILKVNTLYLIAGLCTSYLLSLTISDTDSSKFATKIEETSIIVTCFAVPLIETLFLQLFPIELLKARKFSKKVQFSVSMLLFAGVHFSNSIISGLSGGLVGGIALGYTYLHWRDEGKAVAFLSTWLIHVINNLAVVGLMYLGY